MAKEPLVKEWLAKADEDFDFAFSILSGTTFFSQVSFFFQQAAEKYLKTYIIKHDLEFRKIHDLSKLLEICRRKDPEFKNLSKDCLTLQRFYIETRYPVHYPPGITKDDAELAQEAARRIGNFVKLKLKD